VTLSVALTGAIQQQAGRASVVPQPTARLFSAWMAVGIPSKYATVAQMCQDVLALTPAGQWGGSELFLKAGEGGTWQANFDSNPLALSGPIDLLGVVTQARDAGVAVIPYVNVRARPDWIAGEQLMIRQCVSIAGRCVLNIEPGASFYNGPLDPTFIRDYLAGIGVAPRGLQVCMIPRFTQVAELGGISCLQAWTDQKLVGRASWETYCLSAGGTGASSLCPDVAIPRLDGWGVPPGPQYRVPVVQNTDLANWSSTVWADGGIEVWWLCGD